MKRHGIQKRFGMESLEDRRLMAVDIALTDGVLHLEGDGAHDIVKVSQTSMNMWNPRGSGRGGSFKVPIVNVWHGHREGSQTVFDGTANFLGYLVNEISFHGNEGNDLFENQTAIKSEAHGGMGFDVLKGGSHHDKLFGEGDQDYLYGNDGNDYLVGGGGFDRLVGGGGNDTLRGSGDSNGILYNDNQHDFLSGGQGYDKVVDQVLENAELTKNYLKLASFSGNVVEYNMLSSIESIQLQGNSLDNTIDASAYSGGALHVNGGNGDDVLIGSNGVDVLLGGNGNDTIRGNKGTDVILGGQGDDILDGDEGNDFVFGNDGDDTLRGGKGNDTLLGGSGNDNLYGQAGNDGLKGGTGDDGLFGGAGTDTLTGGADEDRFLFQAGDTIVDKTDQDAQIDFVDLDSWTVTYNGTTINYTAGAWTDDEIELIDQALAMLHHTTGDSTFLKEKDGTEMIYQRVGTSPTNFVAWNGGNVHTFANGTFTGSTDFVLQTVFHEIGHNWDSENDKWDEWKDLSSWTQEDKSGDANYAAGGTGGWFYDSSANFVRNYARTNPKEDFACSFAAYFMDKLGKPFSGVGAAGAPGKMAFMDQFVISKS